MLAVRRKPVVERMATAHRCPSPAKPPHGGFVLRVSTAIRYSVATMPKPWAGPVRNLGVTCDICGEREAVTPGPTKWFCGPCAIYGYPFRSLNPKDS